MKTLLFISLLLAIVLSQQFQQTQQFGRGNPRLGEKPHPEGKRHPPPPMNQGLGNQNQPPILGREQFNPHPFGPKRNKENKDFNSDPFMPPENQFGRRPDQVGEMGKNMNELNPPIRPKDWERHFEGNHMGDSKSHRRMRCFFIGTAILFTCFGACIARCCYRCKRNKKMKIQAMMMKTRTSNEVLTQIEGIEKKVAALKEQYSLKRREQQRVQSQLNYGLEMRARNSHRNMPVYQNHGYPQTNIPMGRPMNESFGAEYPSF